ncbi:MAG: phosphonate metabolism protein/1,5-bisphosphokinase (PRPP-forming) PhnN [Pseudomonadota bacterium]
MTQGYLIAVVGPSGVGKDSVMAGIKAVLPDVHIVKRTVTRPPGMEGEEYISASPETFWQMIENKDFSVHWHAHELYYGIPASVQRDLDAGIDCFANFSRSALATGAAAFPNFCVLNVTADPNTLANRLRERGRETDTQIKSRLAQASKPLPPGLSVIEVQNEGALDTTVQTAIAHLRKMGVQL